MTGGGRRWRCWLLTVAVVFLVSQLRSPTPPRSEGTAAANAFIAGSVQVQPLSPRVLSVPGRTQGWTAREATAQATRETKGKKYRGQVNPRLRSLLASNEFRDLITLLASLEERGSLGSFLERADTYWTGINIFDLAMQEQQKGGKGLLDTIKKDWGRIWPPASDRERMRGYKVLSGFWARLDRSKLIEDVMKTVLPDMDTDWSDKFRSNDDLRTMSVDERREEILSRMGKNEIVKQFVILCKEDKEISVISPRMAPFVAKFVVTLEEKVASSTDQAGKLADIGVAVAAALVVFIGLVVARVIKLPVGTDPTWSSLGLPIS